MLTKIDVCARTAEWNLFSKIGRLGEDRLHGLRSEVQIPNTIKVWNEYRGLVMIRLMEDFGC